MSLLRESDLLLNRLEWCNFTDQPPDDVLVRDLTSLGERCGFKRVLAHTDPTARHGWLMDLQQQILRQQEIERAPGTAARRSKRRPEPLMEEAS